VRLQLATVGLDELTEGLTVAGLSTGEVASVMAGLSFSLGHLDNTS
jgi:hypothetical protein